MHYPTLLQNIKQCNSIPETFFYSELSCDFSVFTVFQSKAIYFDNIMCQASVRLDISGTILYMLLHGGFDHRIRHNWDTLCWFDALFKIFWNFRIRKTAKKLFLTNVLLGLKFWPASVSTAIFLKCTRLHLFKNFSLPIRIIFHSACFMIKLVLSLNTMVIPGKLIFTGLTISIRIVNGWKRVDIFGWKQFPKT